MEGTSHQHQHPRADRVRPGLLAILRPLFTVAGLVAAYYLLPMDEGSAGAIVVLVFGLMAVLALLIWQIGAITRSRFPRLRAVEALAIVIPLFLVLFATAYYLLERAEPGSLSEPLTRTDALYFAVTVFSTVGFGDIVATTQVARVVAMIQMVGGVLLVGVAARVVVGAVQVGLGRQRTEDG